MKKPSGCGIFWLIVAAFVLIRFIVQTPALLSVVAIAIVAIFFVVRANNKRNQARFISEMEDSARILESLAAGKDQDMSVGMALKKGEKIIYVVPMVALTEYQSSGSTYSGMTAGVSFPLFGSLRGNVGGMGGQFVKNPEQLTQVDYGQAIFTNQRIVFSGAKMVRDWDLEKTVSLEPGPNGFNVKIAVSNRERTSGLQAPDLFTFGPGYPAGYVFTLNASGETEAKKWALDLAKQIRDAVATERDKMSPKSIGSK